MKPERTIMDDLIYEHLHRFGENNLFRASLDHFRETGQASGSFRSALHAMMEEYRQSSPVESKWVKVSERLPEDYGLVLIVMTSGARTVGRRLRTNNWGIFTSTGINSESQTNRVEMWQPLPELPIEETKEK